MTDDANTIQESTQAPMSGGDGNADVQTTLPASSSLDGLDESELRALTAEYLNGTLQTTEDTASSEPVEEVQAQVVEETPLPQEETPDGTVEPEGDTTAIKELRIKAASPDDQAAMRIYKASINSGVPMTLAEAVALVQSKKGGTPTTQESTESQTAPATAETVESLEAEIARLEEEYLLAGTEFKTAEMSQIALDLRKAEKRLRQAEKAQEIAETQRTSTLQTADELAIAMYPDAGVPGSQMWNTMDEIHAKMIADNDPALRDPNLSVLVAKWAANRLGVQQASSTPTVVKAPVVQPVKKPATTQARPLQGGTVHVPTGVVDERVLAAQLTTEADLEAARQAYLKRGA